MKDPIERQDVINVLATMQGLCRSKAALIQNSKIWQQVKDLPSAQLETCEGCKHYGRWENEVEYGYSSPCTRCKRRAGDYYEK